MTARALPPLEVGARARLAANEELRVARDRLNAIIEGRERVGDDLAITVPVRALGILLRAVAPHPATGQSPADLLDEAQRAAARYRGDRDEAQAALGAIRAEVLYPGIPDHRHAEAFRAAWHKANEEGRIGERVTDGLAAVLAPIHAALDEAGVQ